MILSYSLISSALLLCGYAVYCLFMAGERQHSFNRASLLIIYISSLLLPLIIMMVPSDGSGAITIGELEGGAVVAGATVGHGALSANVLRTIVAVYMAGALAVVLHTIWCYASLWRMVSGVPSVEQEGVRICVVEGHGILPFCWCNTVVICRSDYEAHGGMIIEHELGHMRKGHWADLVLAQAVLCLQWYNPAAWSMRAMLRSVHDYQADADVLAAGFDQSEYQCLLIEKTVGTRFHSLANSLIHSKLKKRVTMMYKKESSPGSRLRALLLVPALSAGCALASVPAVAHALSSLSAVEIVEKSDSKVNEKNPEIESSPAGNGEIVENPEKIAEYPGGYEGMANFLMNNLQYPEEAYEAGEEGKVVVRFVIAEDGSLNDPEILVSISPSLDAEALRVVKTMPAWIPATKDGKPVATTYAIPISFKLK